MSGFRDIAPVAGAHHERLDGGGYPYQLKGEEICMEVRFLTVVDVFDALSAERPYRAAMPISKAFEILDKDIGTAVAPHEIIERCVRWKRLLFPRQMG